MEVFYIILGIAVLLAAAFYAVGEYFYKVAFKRSEDPPNEHGEYIEKALRGTPTEYMIDEIERGKRMIKEGKSERVSITSYDGLRLSARLFTVPNAKKTAILIHGYRSAGHIDFAGIFRELPHRGYNVLIIDHRAAGESEGDAISYGVKERYDVEAWCRYVSERFGEDERIVLMGCSMGASAALMASELPYVKARVAGIIADCGYSTPREQFRYVLRRKYHLPEFPVLWVSELVCRRRDGWRFDDASAPRALASTTVPVLLIHGDADRYVPVSFTLDNYEACASRKELLIVSGAPHGLSYCKAPALYMAKVDEFLESI